MISVIPAATSHSTVYWMIGLSHTGSISLGTVLVIGNILVPNPATTSTAFINIIAKD